MTLPTTSAIDLCACLLASFPDFQLNCYAFDEFVAPFSQVLTLFNGCVAAMNARLGFGIRRFLTMEFGENATALGSGNDVDLKLIGMSDLRTVIRVTPTVLLWRCSWQQRFFDIQTSANLRKFGLSFVFFIALKNRMPVIPFLSERVFNSATFMPMLIPLKTIRNFSNAFGYNLP